MNKFAVFDIDGTLYRWQLYHELVETLANDELLPTESAQMLRDVWNEWRGGVISFDKYERAVVNVMIENLPKVSIIDFESACNKVVRKSAHKTHYYTRNLLTKLKKKGYKIIAITGSQQELVDRFGERYGFDIVVGAKYERDGDHFTGKTEVMTIGKKPEILRKIVKENNLSWGDSYAIGDSDGDASILELVENPIAFNPSPGLFERAKKDGWPIVIERKNIAYILGLGKNSKEELLLKDTIVY